MHQTCRTFFYHVLPAFALAAALPGIARAGKPTPTPPKPVGNPGDWITESDYPTSGLRYMLEGTSAFRLNVDVRGAPTSCTIIASSSFEVLDIAACDLLMKRGRFAPAHDAKGAPVAGTYFSRVRWVMPKRVQPFADGAFSISLKFDATGRQVSCHSTHEAVSSEIDPCLTMAGIPPEVGRMMRGPAAAVTAEVLVESARGFGAAPPAAQIGPVAGYDRRALQVFTFIINAAGKMSQCRMVEQRGPAELIDDFCDHWNIWTYDVPFDRMGADGSVSGWAVNRILTGKAG